MNVLALETSTEACSVAITMASGVIVSEFDITPRQHTYYLPRMMDSVLQQAGIKKTSIDVIAYASGPGAFTGVRIAAASAQGLAIGLGIPLVPVSTLAVVAQQAADEFGLDKVQVALDARMGEAYRAYYKIEATSGLVELEGKEELVKLGQLLGHTGYHSIGSGFSASRQAGHCVDLQPSVHEDIYPHARALAKLAISCIDRQQLLSADAATINYIRNKVAEKKQRR